MKIFSKFKDYYDFVAGHDTDPRKIYHRITETCICEYWRSKTPKDHTMLSGGKATFDNGSEIEIQNCVFYNPITKRDEFFLGEVAFCDQPLRPYLQNLITGSFYYRYEDIPDDILEMFEKTFLPLAWYETRIKNVKWEPLKDYFRISYPYNKRKYKGLSSSYNPYNKGINAPIVYTRIDVVNEKEDGKKTWGVRYVANGNLGDVKFGQAKSPIETFQDIYNWIPYYEPEMPSDPVDMSRFENKGFDKKTSFRNIK